MDQEVGAKVVSSITKVDVSLPWSRMTSSGLTCASSKNQPRSLTRGEVSLEVFPKQRSLGGEELVHGMRGSHRNSRERERGCTQGAHDRAGCRRLAREGDACWKSTSCLERERGGRVASLLLAIAFGTVVGA